MPNNRQRQTIGILVDRLEDYYQNAVLWTVADAVRARAANLLAFAGGVLEAPDRFAAERNSIFDLARRADLDGLLIMSGTLGNEVGVILPDTDITRPLEL